jgi:hypothetical protein
MSVTWYNRNPFHEEENVEGEPISLEEEKEHAPNFPTGVSNLVVKEDVLDEFLGEIAEVDAVRQVWEETLFSNGISLPGISANKIEVQVNGNK